MKRFAYFIICSLLAYESHASELSANQEKVLSNKENLTYIQTVSTSKKTFVIRKGLKDGVLSGQKSLFSTRNASITAVAVEVNGDYSAWRVSGKEGLVPFAKREAVIFASNPDRIWSEVALLQMKQIETEEQIKSLYIDSREHIITIRGAISFTLNQSTDEASGDRNPTTRGYSFELLYGQRFMNHFEISAGLRLDKEETSIEGPSLLIPTSRKMIVADAIYHFNPNFNSKSHYYIGIGLGLGSSSSTVNEEVKTGSTKLLPAVRLGYESLLSKKSSFIVEAVFESISSEESFSDGGSNDGNQVTGLVNSKISLGLRF